MTLCAPGSKFETTITGIQINKFASGGKIPLFTENILWYYTVTLPSPGYFTERNAGIRTQDHSLSHL